MKVVENSLVIHAFTDEPVQTPARITSPGLEPAEMVDMTIALFLRNVLNQTTGNGLSMDDMDHALRCIRVVKKAGTGNGTLEFEDADHKWLDGWLMKHGPSKYGVTVEPLIAAVREARPKDEGRSGPEDDGDAE